MRTLAIILMAITIIAISLLSYRYGVTLSSDAFGKFLDSSLAFSAIIFAIIGAWVVLIHPRAIQSYFFKAFENIEEEAEKKGITVTEASEEIVEKIDDSERQLKKLVRALVLTSLVMFFTLSYRVLLLFLGEIIPEDIKQSAFLGSASVAVSLLIFFVQCYVLILITFANYEILHDVQKSNVKVKAKAKGG